MLISFAVENFLSFKDRVEFSMKKASKSPAGIENIKDGILKSACIYGVNNSGKTNLLRAIRFVVDIIKSGDVSRVYETHYSYVPNDNSVSRFEICFRQNKHEYKYVLECNAVSVGKEELYRDNKTVFKRVSDTVLDYGMLAGESYYTNRRFSVTHLFLSKLYADNVLQEQRLKHKVIFEDVYRWLHSVVYAYTDKNNKTIFYNYNNPLEIFSQEEPRIIKYLNGVLCKIDPTINEIVWKSVEIKETKDITDSIYIQFRDIVPETLFVRKGDDFFIWEYSGSDKVSCKKLFIVRDNRECEIAWESDGVKKIIELSALLCLMEEIGVVALIDDFDSYLHPLIVEQLLHKIINSCRDSQLIATFHNIGLMNYDLWRVDQIWFTQKSAEKGTDLYSLQRYAPRFDKDILKEYKKGVYGALPNRFI